MIIVKLIGGLGNQMYQYAYGLQLAAEYKEAICFDTSFYPKGEQPALYHLNVPHYPLWDTVGIERSEIARVKLEQKLYHVLQKTIRVLGRTDRTGNLLFHSYAKRGLLFNFDPYYYDVPRCDRKNKYIYGYFQGEQYFSQCIPLLRQQFTVSGPLGAQAQKYQEQIRNMNSVALHIRLGDYKNSANTDLDVCSVSYYRRGIQYVCDALQDPVLFVFTNDIQAATNMLEFPENTIFVQETKDYEDFALMSQCKHFVLSNSTFSWWAAYLAENSEKIVTVPQKWRHSEKEEPAIYMPYMVKLPIDGEGTIK